MAAPPVRTVQQIIEGAYRKIGVYAAGETVSPEDMADGLIGFQDLLAELAGEGITVPSYMPEYITMVITKVEYTIGEDGAPDKDAVRPNSITSAFIRSGGYDYPVKVIGEKAYTNIFDKSGSGSRPEFLWYNPVVPNGIVSVWPPPIAADRLYLYYPRQLIDGAALVDDIMITLGIPRNYHNPLVFLLAIDLAPEHGVDVPLVVAARAVEGKTKIIALNAANRVQPAVIEFAQQDINSDLDPY